MIRNDRLDRISAFRRSLERNLINPINDGEHIFKTGSSGVFMTADSIMQILGYEWDGLMKRYKPARRKDDNHNGKE